MRQGAYLSITVILGAAIFAAPASGDELDDLKERVARLESALSTLEQAHQAKSMQVDVLSARVGVLERTNEELRQRLDARTAGKGKEHVGEGNDQKERGDSLVTRADLQRQRREIEQLHERTIQGLAADLVEDDEFTRELAGTLGRSELWESLATTLPGNRTFLKKLTESSDFQKAMAYQVSKSQLEPFAEGLVEDDSFQRALEDHLVDSDRYLRELAQALTRTNELPAGLLKHDRFMRDLSDKHSRGGHLKKLSDAIANDDGFQRELLDDSGFMDHLSRNDRLINGLTGNSTFIRKLKSALR